MSLQSAARPTIYLDTTVLLDVVDNRSESANQMLETIRDQNFNVMASPFGILEMLEARKTDMWAESMLERGYTVVQISRRMGSRRTGPTALIAEHLAEVYTSTRHALQGPLDMVRFPEPSPGLMDQAEDICAATMLAGDSLHLATALYFDCQLLVSSDSDLIRIARNYINATPSQGFSNAVANLF